MPGVPDDLDPAAADMFELVAAPATGADGAGNRRRRLRRGLLVAVAALAVAGVVAVAAGADRSDRTDIKDRPAPTPAPAPDRQVGPAPGPGAARGPAPPARGPVVEGLALRADGGLGAFAFGARRAQVVGTARRLLGDPTDAARPVAATVPCTSDPRVAPTWTTYQDTIWDDITLSFAGPAPDDLRLVGWSVVALPGAPRRFRMAGGPIVDDPLPAWGAAYGSAVDVERLAGDAGQAKVTAHLPGGDVRIVGYAAASAGAVVVRGGTTCTASGALDGAPEPG